MSQAKPNFLIRIWRFFWGSITWLRIAVLNILFLIFLVVIVSAIMKSAPKPVSGSGPLLLAPSGRLVDQLSYEAPLNALTGNNKPNETLTIDLIDTIHHASVDDRVTGIILNLNDLMGGGISKIEEVGQAITHFKNTGKPVIAYSDSYDQQQYLLASYANTIHMHDMGNVAITGFGLYRNYFKTLIDKLGINVNVFRSGTFKDFVEPYIRTDMSAASREHNQEWITALWASYSNSIEQRRGLDEGSISQYVTNIGTLMAKHDGDVAALALDYQLVDSIGSKQTLIHTLGRQFGYAKDNTQMFHYISQFDYQQELAIKGLQAKGNIGLIVAAGNIMDGDQPAGTIGGDSLSHLIRKARDNSAIKALMIRVDSGGGSAFASEVIRQEIEATRDSGKPVFISMGSVAASGGYWLATAADQIWATQSTITGSIGVFSIIPTFEQTLDKIGVNNDGFATSDVAGLFRLERKMTPQSQAVFQTSVDSIYRKFLKLSADSRKTTVDEIKKVAEGRVWLGTQAIGINLVDELGSLQDAIQALAAYAKIDDPAVIRIEKDLSPAEQIMRSLMMGANSILPKSFWTKSSGFSFFASAQSLLDKEPMVRVLKEQMNNSSNPDIYALCTDCKIIE